MKRPLLATLIIGIFVVVGVSAMHLSPQVLQFESRAADFISPYAAATHVVPKQWQYVFMSILSFGVAALTVTSLRRRRIGLIALGLLIELAAVSWICSLYRVFFQPLPSMFAVAIAFIVADRYTAITQRGRAVTARAFFSDRLSKEQVQRMIAGGCLHSDGRCRGGGGALWFSGNGRTSWRQSSARGIGRGRPISASASRQRRSEMRCAPWRKLRDNDCRAASKW